MKLEVDGLTRTKNNLIYLSNFWESDQNYVGVTDTTKNFLIDILVPIAKKYGQPINVSSVVHEPKRLIHQTKEVFKRKFFTPKNNLTNLQILHGQLNPSRPREGFINIWYTAENIRPPLSQDWDVFLSFDTDEIDPRNLYLPFWVTRLGATVRESQHWVDIMCSERPASDFPDKFASLVASNPERIRMGFVDFLKKNSEIDIYGQLGVSIRDKSECISDYKFNLAFENDLYPGYVTEKVFDAWKSRSIPIWRGLDSQHYLNEKAFLNATNISFNDIFRRMIDISNNLDLFNQFTTQPILQRRYDIGELRRMIDLRVALKFSN